MIGSAHEKDKELSCKLKDGESTAEPINEKDDVLVATNDFKEAIKIEELKDGDLDKVSWMLHIAWPVLIAGKGREYNYAVLGLQSPLGMSTRIHPATWQYREMLEAINACLRAPSIDFYLVDT